MARQNRVKECNRCSQAAPILYRVKYEPESDWAFICRECWNVVSQNNPFYVYGGTWKAQKKR